jgi:hypothetical protein
MGIRGSFLTRRTIFCRPVSLRNSLGLTVSGPVHLASRRRREAQEGKGFAYSSSSKDEGMGRSTRPRSDMVGN